MPRPLRRAQIPDPAAAIKPTVTEQIVDLMGSDSQPHTFTDVADFVRLLATFGTRPEAPGQVWFAPGNPPLTQIEFIRLIEAELGRHTGWRER